MTNTSPDSRNGYGDAGQETLDSVLERRVGTISGAAVSEALTKVVTEIGADDNFKGVTSHDLASAIIRGARAALNRWETNHNITAAVQDERGEPRTPDTEPH